MGVITPRWGNGMRLTTQSRVCGSWSAVSVAVKADRIPGSLADYRGRAPLRRSVLDAVTD